MNKEYAEIQLSDYSKPNFEVGSIDLCFDLFEDKAIVTNKMNIERREEGTLFLHGKNLKLLSLLVSGQEFPYIKNDEGIKLVGLPSDFNLEIVTEIYPQSNTTGEGLYKSGDIFCTQNEAEGFRNITYYFDRPDVMSIFTTKVIADKKKYPTLLANGNKTGEGELFNGRHWVSWHDPHKKPCYLFALVAGDFALVEDSFKTKSGRDVKLEIFVDKGNEDRCDHAMSSLKKSMKWDEEVFGLEYDLDIYMIVAVDSFNMGAMENKGLNIFNSVYVLAKKETATDEEFLGIEGVIAHEYFHNWTGNRVTCRDWFQLTLKEGLTVFRDQLFSADMFDATVQRIMDVSGLKTGQFPEDAGAMAHPIKPKSYIEINNFYTATVYQKGAEVIRMIQTLIGVDSFKKGITKYFELYDGQAVRTEDFINAMEIASSKDLTQFKRWYDYAGTPTISIKANLDAGKFIIEFTQSLPSNGNSKLELQPLHIPFYYAVNGETKMIELTDFNHKVELENTFNSTPTCEWNLDFSAPVHVLDNLGRKNLQAIVKEGTNSFSRWEAFQQLVIENVRTYIESPESYDNSKLILLLSGALSNDFPAAIKAHLLNIPSEVQLNSELSKLNPEKVQNWITSFYESLIKNNSELTLSLYNEARESDFNLSATSMGKRLLRGQCLNYMAYSAEFEEKVLDHYKNSDNMNDQYRSMAALVRANSAFAQEALDHFYTQWSSDNLVINKWLSLQATRKDSNILDLLETISSDKVFSWKEPNKVRSLFGTFAMRNLSQFHHESGGGYRFIAGVIKKLDQINPQVGSRIATSFRDARKLSENNKNLVKEILGDLLNELKSPDCSEIIGKTLKALELES